LREGIVMIEGVDGRRGPKPEIDVNRGIVDASQAVAQRLKGLRLLESRR
jgi:hypothetical protein